jgi:hypothetical protein
MDAKAILIYFVIPFLGIGIILFCILSFLFPFGERLRDRTQKIQGPWNIHLEVSAVTLFFIVGVILCVSSVYLYTFDYEKRLKEQEGRLAESLREHEEELAKLRKEYEGRLASQKMDLQAYVKLEGAQADPSLRDHKKFVSRYLESNRPEPVEGDVARGPYPGSFSIKLREVTPDTAIRLLELEEKAEPHRKWKYELQEQQAYWPLQPTLDLRRSQTDGQ